MGNHGNYCNRFPGEYRKYSGELALSEYGVLAENKDLWDRVNCYDNSVLYNDFVVGSIIERAKQQPGKISVVYMSDHADDVFSMLGHNSSKFTYSMTQIPFIFWASDALRNEKTELFARLQSRVNELFPNDRFYDTIIGWAGIKTPHY